MARVYQCPHIWGKGGRAIIARVHRSSRVSSLLHIMARILGRGGRANKAPVQRSSHVSSLAYYGRERGPNNRCSRKTQLARIFARKLGGGPGNHSSRVSRDAYIIARVYHCPQIGEGEAREIIAHVYHNSRVSLLANWGGRGPGNYSSQA